MKTNSLVYKIIIEGYGKVMNTLATNYANWYNFFNTPVDRAGNTGLDLKLNALEDWLIQYKAGEVYFIHPTTAHEFLVYMAYISLVAGTIIFVKIALAANEAGDMPPVSSE